MIGAARYHLPLPHKASARAVLLELPIPSNYFIYSIYARYIMDHVSTRTYFINY